MHYKLYLFQLYIILIGKKLLQITTQQLATLPQPWALTLESSAHPLPTYLELH